MDDDRPADDRRRILAYVARLGLGAAVVGAVGGWYADGWIGAVVGALLMGLVFAPCVGLLAYGLVRRRGPRY